MDAEHIASPSIYRAALQQNKTLAQECYAGSARLQWWVQCRLNTRALKRVDALTPTEFADQIVLAFHGAATVRFHRAK